MQQVSDRDRNDTDEERNLADHAAASNSSIEASN